VLQRVRGRPVTVDALLTCPALLAPAALLFPWVATGGHLGIELGGFGSFLAWSTKYPNLGPVNVQVLAGALCVVLASALPALLAIYRIGRESRTLVVGLLASTAVVAYVPVLIRLDLTLFVLGVFDPLVEFEAAVGPLVRALAVAATVAMALRVARARRIRRPTAA